MAIMSALAFTLIALASITHAVLAASGCNDACWGLVLNQPPCIAAFNPVECACGTPNIHKTFASCISDCLKDDDYDGLTLEHRCGAFGHGKAHAEFEIPTPEDHDILAREQGPPSAHSPQPADPHMMEPHNVAPVTAVPRVPLIARGGTPMSDIPPDQRESLRCGGVPGMFCELADVPEPTGISGGDMPEETSTLVTAFGMPSVINPAWTTTEATQSPSMQGEKRSWEEHTGTFAHYHSKRDIDQPIYMGPVSSSVTVVASAAPYSGAPQGSSEVASSSFPVGLESSSSSGAASRSSVASTSKTTTKTLTSTPKTLSSNTKKTQTTVAPTRTSSSTSSTPSSSSSATTSRDVAWSGAVFGCLVASVLLL